MDPIEKIVPLDWMMAPATVAVIEALTADGADARFVGGCVRDALLKLPVKDIDIATSASPDHVEGLFAQTIPVGKAFGVVVVVMESGNYEVTTFRKELRLHRQL